MYGGEKKKKKKKGENMTESYLVSVARRQRPTWVL